MLPYLPVSSYLSFWFEYQLAVKMSKTIGEAERYKYQIYDKTEKMSFAGNNNDRPFSEFS